MERTFELTNFCPHLCAYCSSNATADMATAIFLPFAEIKRQCCEEGPFDTIVLSGGEPLAHPDFYKILVLCQEHAKDVVVYSNAIRHLVYNANVLDGVYLEANLSVLPGLDRLHVLKRVEQGREAVRPEVVFSHNWKSKACDCTHVVVGPDGVRGRPCKKRA